MTSKPLEGVRILDLGRMFAAPFAAQILGDLGAEVIKIEIAGGDEMRHYGPPFLQATDEGDLPESTYSICCNRNKRSVVADLKSPDGQRLVRDLALRADVLIENFKPGTLARFGLDYAALSAANPELVYCSLTGFGQEGPYIERPGVDSMFQAMTGMMMLTGEPDGEPQRIGFVAVDFVSGLYAATAILAAIHERARSGEGQQIDLALLDCAFSLMAHRATEYLMAGTEPMRRGSRSSGNVPGKNFLCSLGTVNIQAGSEDQFRKLCTALDRPDLVADERFATRRGRMANDEALYEILETIFLERTAQDWFERLNGAGVYCAPLNTVSEGFDDPHVVARGVVETLDHPVAGPVRLIANPIRFGRTPISGNKAPPLIGEHSDEVARDIDSLWPARAPTPSTRQLA